MTTKPRATNTSADEANDENLALNKPGIEVYWFDDLGTGNETFRFLSNFYEGAPLVLAGLPSEEFRTGEHAFAAFKADTVAGFFQIKSQPTPSAAKSAGRKTKLRRDWEQVKYDVMAAVIRSKFAPGREEAERLLATQDAYLCEGTYWYDQEWGVDLREGRDAGANWLGSMLMMRRAELRAHRDFGVAIPDGSFNLRKAGFGFVVETTKKDS